MTVVLFFSEILCEERFGAVISKHSVLWFTLCNVVPLLVRTLAAPLNGWPNACYDSRVPSR